MNKNWEAAASGSLGETYSMAGDIVGSFGGYTKDSALQRSNSVSQAVRQRSGQGNCHRLCRRHIKIWERVQHEAAEAATSWLS